MPGDRINATIYAVLSNVRGPEMEASVTPKMREDIERALTYADGCYDYHHTLQADSLWIPMRTLDDLNSLVSRWILTLEKQVILMIFNINTKKNTLNYYIFRVVIIS